MPATKTPTIARIKQATATSQPHFFSRKTLHFFGQTMRDFKVRKSPQGRIFIFAKMYMGVGGAPFGYTFWEFANDDLILPCYSDGTPAPKDNLQDIFDFIKAN